MPAPRYYTAEMVRDLPDDGNRYEVVYGELVVAPAPRLWHQVLVQRLTVALDGYLRTEPVGVVLTAGQIFPGARTCWSSRMYSWPCGTRRGPWHGAVCGRCC